MVFTGADSSINPFNAFFALSISESKDATQYPSPPATTVEAYRLRGWYLGVDVSNIMIKDIKLTNYPDISNNSYNDWDITLTQDFAGSQSSQTLTYALKIGKVPINPVSISNFATVQQTPALTADFFGISRPTNPTVCPMARYRHIIRFRSYLETCTKFTVQTINDWKFSLCQRSRCCFRKFYDWW